MNTICASHDRSMEVLAAYLLFGALFSGKFPDTPYPVQCPKEGCLGIALSPGHFVNFFSRQPNLGCNLANNNPCNTKAEDIAKMIINLHTFINA